MQKTITSIGVGVVGLALLALAVFLIVGQARQTFASAPSGLPAQVSSSTTVVVGPHLVGASSTKPVLIIATGNCAARIISTTADRAIYLSFDAISSTTPIASSTIGVLHATGTTVAYDSGIYGCGLVSGVAIGSTTVTVTETR